MDKSKWDQLSDLEKAKKLAERAVANPDMDPSYIFAPGYRQHALLGSQFLAALTRAERAEGENERLAKLVYVPGLWRCAKCRFSLLQGNLNVPSGTVTARNDPGDHCPNCDSPLWCVSERDAGNELVDRLTAMADERDTALARIAELEGEVEWRPIESAPKDGTEILTVGLDSPKVIATRWLDPGPFIRTQELNYYKDVGWYWGSWNQEVIGPVSPTHWRPLPTPPRKET